MDLYSVVMTLYHGFNQKNKEIFEWNEIIETRVTLEQAETILQNEQKMLFAVFISMHSGAQIWADILRMLQTSTLWLPFTQLQHAYSAMLECA